MKKKMKKKKWYKVEKNLRIKLKNKKYCYLVTVGDFFIFDAETGDVLFFDPNFFLKGATGSKSDILIQDIIGTLNGTPPQRKGVFYKKPGK